VVGIINLDKAPRIHSGSNGFTIDHDFLFRANHGERKEGLSM
jgi:hypothetical protein